MDINAKEFRKVIRGYDCDGVDEFLDKIAEDYETLYKENSSIKEKISLLNEKLEQYLRIETTLQNTLILAQNASDQAKENSHKEAELVIRNANDTAARIIDKAQNQVLGVEDEYNKTRQDFIKFKTKFRNFMKTQLETFDSLDHELTKDYDIGTNAILDNIKGKDIETISENNLEKDEDYLEDNSLGEIKSFSPTNK